MEELLQSLQVGLLHWSEKDMKLRLRDLPTSLMIGGFQIFLRGV